MAIFVIAAGILLSGCAQRFHKLMNPDITPHSAVQILYTHDGLKAHAKQIQIYEDPEENKKYFITTSYLPKVEMLLGCLGQSCDDANKIKLFRRMAAKYDPNRSSIVITKTHDLDPVTGALCRKQDLAIKSHTGTPSCRETAQWRKKNRGERPRRCQSREAAARVLRIADGLETSVQDVYVYQQEGYRIFTHKNYQSDIERLVALQTEAELVTGNKLKRLDVNGDMVITDREDIAIMYPKLTGKKR